MVICLEKGGANLQGETEDFRARALEEEYVEVVN